MEDAGAPSAIPSLPMLSMSWCGGYDEKPPHRLGCLEGAIRSWQNSVENLKACRPTGGSVSPERGLWELRAHLTCI